MKKREWDRIDQETRDARMKEWAEGGNKKEGEGHDLIIEKHNEEFVQYYKGAGIMPEGQFDQFYAKLKEPLDICFRINCVDKNFQKTKEEVEKQV